MPEAPALAWAQECAGDRLSPSPLGPHIPFLLNTVPAFQERKEEQLCSAPGSWVLPPLPVNQAFSGFPSLYLECPAGLFLFSCQPCLCLLQTQHMGHPFSLAPVWVFQAGLGIRPPSLLVRFLQ